MTLDQPKAFFPTVKGGSSLQEMLKAAKSTEDIVGIAKEHGHEFSADKVRQLTDQELESVAGGQWSDSWAGCFRAYV